MSTEAPTPGIVSAGWRLVTDQKVSHRHRVTLPLPARERLGVEPGDIVDTIVVADGDEIHLGEMKLDAQSRINIRSYLVDHHDIDAEYVDLFVREVPDAAD